MIQFSNLSMSSGCTIARERRIVQHIRNNWTDLKPKYTEGWFAMGRSAKNKTQS